MLYSILDWIFIPLLRKRTNQVEGRENIPPVGNYILAMNHQFCGDSLFVCANFLPYTQKKIYFITAESVWRLADRWHLRDFLGMIPKLESQPAQCLPLAENILKQQGFLGIFPEGKLDKDSLIKGRTGVARLALWAKKPVLPIGILGLRTRRRGFRNFLKTFFSKQPIIIKIGKPLTFEEYYRSAISKEILEKITRRIMQAISRLTGVPYHY